MPILDIDYLMKQNEELIEENKKLKGFADELINEAFNFCRFSSDGIIETGEKYGLIKNNKKTFK